jgi:hypothetical protein
MRQQTAILFFSRTATDEANVKSFVSNKKSEKNVKIAGHLIQHTLSVARNSNLPVFSCYSSNQKGNNFGERLANAIEEIYNKGFQKVITIGNDCPSITSQLLSNVGKQLNKDKLVLGPSSDGGVYLIGIDKSVYNRNSFLNLQWLNKGLQETWTEYASDFLITLNWLKQESDIDSELDLFQYLKRVSSKFAHLLKQLFTKVEFRKFSRYFTANSVLLTRNTSCKAPPFIFL